MFNYDQLEALEAIVANGSFQRAARALKVTQSAISQRIRTLEEVCGEPVLNRTAPPTATKKGALLIDHVRRVRIFESEILDAQREEIEPFRTTIRIGVNADSLATWFLDALSDTFQRHSVLFNIILENEDLSYRLLETGEVVGCITNRQEPLPGGDREPLGALTYRCVASRSFASRFFPHGLTTEAARHAPAVLFNLDDLVHSRFLTRSLGWKNPYFPHHLVPSSNAFLELVQAGIGYGMVASLQVDHLIAKRQLVDLCPGTTLKVPLFWHYPRREGEVQRELRRALIARAKDKLKNKPTNSSTRQND